MDLSFADITAGDSPERPYTAPDILDEAKEKSAPRSK